uniref:Similarity. Hypothetical start n=1 Tax=Microcystis aeruginosa (strain PCC 7806) TaxID=267872 RepID=A8YE05_MICA7|nr:unnamed protein product [Microcystis aeruginosa PCC 7806]
MKPNALPILPHSEFFLGDNLLTSDYPLPIAAKDSHLFYQIEKILNMITLVTIFFTALLAVTDFTYQVLIHFPIQIINSLGSLLSYGVIGLIILVLVWIVGD